MSWEFYNAVIEEECKQYGLKRDKLKPAFKKISKAYCENSLKTGDTFVDYDDPGNRCAYLHKFATLHTSLVNQYFTKFLQEKKRRKILGSKQTLNICCLGGGPGTDIIGIFKALVKFPQFHKKVVKIVILDICRGWCNSYKFIITNLLDGKIKEIPASFIDTSKFIAEIIEVNLLETLPGNVVEAIAAADIVCSIKFISAIYSDPASLRAMKTITNIIKPDAVLLFIDNFRANIYKLVETVSKLSEFKILLGPLHESFKNCASKKSMAAFEYVSPSTVTKISVIGMLKLEKTGSISNGTMLNSPPSLNSNVTNSCISNVKFEIDDDINAQTSALPADEDFNLETSLKENKFTQTNADLHFDDNSTTRLENVLEPLVTALNSLLVNVDKYVQQTCQRKCCSCYHC